VGSYGFQMAPTSDGQMAPTCQVGSERERGKRQQVTSQVYLSLEGLVTCCLSPLSGGVLRKQRLRGSLEQRRLRGRGRRADSFIFYMYINIIYYILYIIYDIIYIIYIYIHRRLARAATPSRTRSSSRLPAPSTLNPKPQTPNSQPQTLNPTP